MAWPWGGGLVAEPGCDPTANTHMEIWFLQHWLDPAGEDQNVYSSCKTSFFPSMTFSTNQLSLITLSHNVIQSLVAVFRFVQYVCCPVLPAKSTGQLSCLRGSVTLARVPKGRMRGTRHRGGTSMWPSMWSLALHSDWENGSTALSSTAAALGSLGCSPALTAVRPDEEVPDGITPSPLLHLLYSRLFDLMSLLLLLHGLIAPSAADRFCFLNNSQRTPENVKLKCREVCCYS